MSDCPILEKAPVCLGRVTPTSWLSSSASIDLLLAAEVPPAPVGCMSWNLDNAAHFSSFSNCWMQIVVGSFSLKWTLHGFWHLWKQSSLRQLRVTARRYWWIWNLAYFWHFRVPCEAFRSDHTKYGMSYHQHTDILQLSSCGGDSDGILLWVQKTAYVEKTGNVGKMQMSRVISMNLCCVY